MVSATEQVAKYSCTGKVKTIDFDFDMDRERNPTIAGETPFKLPFGVRVTGRRTPGDTPRYTKNDLAFFNSSASYAGGLASADEGNVIVISETLDKSPPSLSSNKEGM